MSVLLPESGCTAEELKHLGYVKESLSATGKTKVPTSGPLDAELAVIGDGPGRKELQEGKPLIGLSGQFLNKVLDEQGENPKSVLRGNIYEQPEVPTAERTDELGNERLAELEKYKQLASILAISRIAGEGLSKAPGNMPMSEMRKVEATTPSGVPIHTTYHPSAIMRSGQRKSKYYAPFLEDLQKALEDVRKKRASIDLKKETPQGVHIEESPDLPAHYNLRTKQIHVPDIKNEGVLAHELAHAQLGHKSTLPNYAALASLLASPAILGATAGLSTVSPYVDSIKNKVYLGTALSSLALASPLLYRELQANLHASKIVNKAHGGKASILEKLSPAQGFPSYVATAAIPSVLATGLWALDRSKQAAAAKGIPDRRYYGSTANLKPGQLADFLRQRHDAYRAGRHQDWRIGDERGLHSWATRKPPPKPGSKIMLAHQPVHSHSYLGWEGEIPRGQYGGGRVKVEDIGKALITRVSDNSIHFTLAHTRYPQRFVLFRPDSWRTGQGRSWLLMNTTPTEMSPFSKIKYKKVDSDKIEPLIASMQKGDALEPKLDGSSTLVSLLKNDAPELTSYRQSKVHKGPLLYTEAVLKGQPRIENLPPHLRGSVLRGEIYGVRTHEGKENVIGQQELSGLLNSSLLKSLESQKSRNVKLKTLIYDIARYGNKQETPPSSTPRPDRRKMMEELAKYLPKDTFRLSEEATNPEDAKKLWNTVRTHKHPLTHEGAVFHPNLGAPTKIPLTPESDVHVTGVFPGEGRLKGTHAGGFTYATEAGGKTVGNVGTGLSDEARKELWDNQKDYIGRVAKIRHKGQFTSGAYRAPGFRGWHSDYPLAKPAKEAADSYFAQALRTEPIAYDNNRGIVRNLLNHASKVYNRGQSLMQRAYNSDYLGMQFKHNPQNERMQRFLEALNGQDRVVKNPIDKMIQQYGPTTLNLG